jgi:hypothetical protein
LRRLQVSQSTPIQFLFFELPNVKRIVQIPQLIHHDLRELAPESESLHAMLSCFNKRNVVMLQQTQCCHPSTNTMLSSFNKHTSQAKWAADLPAEARALRSSLYYGSRPQNTLPDA